MLCSKCGFENPAVHRFCGMCGTPLPQKPITTPGAQSALSFTSLPIEVPQASTSTLLQRSGPAQTPTETEDSSPAAAAAAPSEAPLADTQSHVPADQVLNSPAEKNYFSQAQEAESLEQFIAGFHYSPPSAEDEVTMTGDKPVADDTANPQTPAPAVLSEEPAVEVAAEEEPPSPAPVSTEDEPSVPPPFATKSTRAEAPERSRFLDLSEPAAPETHAEPAPGIGGPSFLDLSDAPVPPPEEAAASKPRGPWRAWAAVLVILIFTGLGFLEWRAEKNHSSGGPVGIIKMQIERLKGKKGPGITPANTSAPAPEATPSTGQPPPRGSGPDLQAIPSHELPTDSTPGSNQPAAAPEKSTSQPTPAPQSQALPAGNVAAATSDGKTSTEGVGADTVTVSAAKPGGGSNTARETQTPDPPPGAEELLKAQNAGDAAAASAWLWKSVAKGNPQAPIKLANMYITGEGVPQNCEQALVLLRSAAAKENAAAISRLGSLYATGTCVPRDRVRAFQYMSSAVEANPKAAWARDFREQLWAHMTPQERSQAQKYR